jgi:hypothetical protein
MYHTPSFQSASRRGSIVIVTSRLSAGCRLTRVRSGPGLAFPFRVQAAVRPRISNMAHHCPRGAVTSSEPCGRVVMPSQGSARAASGIAKVLAVQRGRGGSADWFRSPIR